MKVHAIRCRCGQVQGRVQVTGSEMRAVCYCSWCQAFARFLGREELVLDEHGGTDIVAARPHTMAFTQGLDDLACVSLSPRTLRWYASCCRTAIANTPADWRMPHAGIVHSCLELDGQALDESFGPVTMRLARNEARGTPPAGKVWAAAAGLAHGIASMIWARASGRYQRTPFFYGSGKPRAEPLRLAREEVDRLRKPS